MQANSGEVGTRLLERTLVPNSTTLGSPNEEIDKEFYEIQKRTTQCANNPEMIQHSTVKKVSKKVLSLVN